MEEDILFSNVQIKKEELEEAFNEIMNQEEHLSDDMIKSEILEEDMLFDDINGDDILGSLEMREDYRLPNIESYFKSMLKKYSHMRKTGSKNRWQCFKFRTARKRKTASTSKKLLAMFKARKSKIKREELSEKTNNGCEPQEIELKQPKEEPLEEEGSLDANQNMSGLFSDEMLYCDECSRLWDGDCPEHGPLFVIQDAAFPEDVHDKNRAEKTSPPQVSVSNTEAESGVWAHEVIPARTRFGPYEGKKVPPEVCTPYSWLVRKDGQPCHCIDATEPSLSNWMRFVNCARHNGQQNLHAFQFKGKVYYRTIRAVDPGEELLVWFDAEYARQLGASSEFICGKSYMDVCPDCPYPCASPLYLLEHKKLLHGELGTVRKPTKAGFEASSRRERRSYNRSAKISASYKESSVNISNGSPISDINIDDLAPTVNPETGDQCFACPVCQKLILRRSHLKRHLLIHSDVKPYICKFCEKGFTRKDNFDSHVKLRHAHEFVPAVSARQPTTPMKEKQPTTPVKEKSVSPPEPQSSPRGHLSRRQQTVAVEKPFVCSQCSERFSKAEEVQAHMATHVREKAYVCAECNKRFVNNAGLMMHQRIHKNMSLGQGNRKPRANRMCRVCGLQCRSLEHLTSHEHTHEDRFSKCFVCGKKFSHVNHLKRHLLIHAGYRPYGCSHCEQKFSRAEHLKRHIRTHTRQGAYECGHCKKRFAKEIVFERHTRLHNADAPCLQDQRLSVHHDLQKQLERYINEDEDDCQDEEQEEYDDDDEEPLLNVFPEVILGAEN